ncbi:MAG: carbon-nitrogen hydrolase family protein [Campylobacterota bacterium]|nr:carbon-nitrogen hydrolase family protein [Campylobacterota bacterium]
MRRFVLYFFLLFSISIVANDLAHDEGDGTPTYNKTVRDSYHKLQFKMSIYEALPTKGKGIRLGIYQSEAAYGEGATEKNMARLERAVKRAKTYDVQLLSFPELYLPGYTLSPKEVKEVAEFKDGVSISRGQEIAKKYTMGLLLPYAQKVKAEDETVKYYDSIAVISEKGELLESYQKTHLYGQQERDNWSFGNNRYRVHKFFGFPVGVLNCYECEFPELSRILALKGAKLIVGPTAADNYYTLPNGKRSDVPYPDISKLLIPAYAYANNLFFAYSNRSGYERRGEDEWHYQGNSVVSGPHGDIIVAANHEQDTMLIVDCIPGYYGMTHPAPKYNYLKDRRPDMYRELIAPEVD